MNSNSQCSSCQPTWKKNLAFLIDLLGSFLIFGFIVAYFSGDLTKDGFELNGMPALALFSLIIAYFFIMKKYCGRTLGKKLFGIHSKNDLK